MAASQPLKAASWMIGAMVSFSLMAISGRELAPNLNTFEIMFFRSLIGFAIVLIIGCFGILNSKSIINSLFSLDVIDTATISIFVLIAGFSGYQTPIVTDVPRYSNYSDPYPQAIILTAIVIGFATQALLCSIALRLSRSAPLLRYKDLEK